MFFFPQMQFFTFQCSLFHFFVVPLQRFKTNLGCFISEARC